MNPSEDYIIVKDLLVSKKGRECPHDHRSEFVYAVSQKPKGNCVLVNGNSPQEVAQIVLEEYEEYESRLSRLNIPISKSYLERWGTGME